MRMLAKCAVGALAAAVLAPVLAAPAASEDLIDGSDPNVIVEIASGFGSATLSKDDLGDPMIEGRINGLLYYVFFYGCKDGANCTALQFATSFEDAGADLETVNAWNREKRFGAAFLDEAGDASLQYDMNLAFGVSRSNLDDTFDYWRVVLGEFRNHIGW